MKEYTILVVEDTENCMKYQEAALKAIGKNNDVLFNILRAKTGNQMVDIAKANSIDLMLVDINLPEKSGLKAFLELKDHYKEKNLEEVPAICVTAYALNGDSKKFLDAGFTSYISKPYDVQSLEEKMRSILKYSFSKN